MSATTEEPRARPTAAEAPSSWARERLANYKVPREVVAVSALPTNATGKILKSELRARAAADLAAR